MSVKTSTLWLLQLEYAKLTRFGLIVVLSVRQVGLMGIKIQKVFFIINVLKFLSLINPVMLMMKITKCVFIVKKELI